MELVLLLLALRLWRRRLEDGPQVPQDDRVVHVLEGLLPEASLGNQSSPFSLSFQLDVRRPLRNGFLPPGLGALLPMHHTVFVGAAADAQIAGAI